MTQLFGMDAKHVKILIFSLVLNVRCVSVQGCYTIQAEKEKNTQHKHEYNGKVFQRLKSIKQAIFLKKRKEKISQ